MLVLRPSPRILLQPQLLQRLRDQGVAFRRRQLGVLARRHPYLCPDRLILCQAVHLLEQEPSFMDRMNAVLQVYPSSRSTIKGHMSTCRILMVISSCLGILKATTSTHMIAEDILYCQKTEMPGSSFLWTADYSLLYLATEMDSLFIQSTLKEILSSRWIVLKTCNIQLMPGEIQFCRQ